MPHLRLPNLRAAQAAGTAALLAATGLVLAPTAHAGGHDCFDRSTGLTVEQTRAGRDNPQEILAASTFDARVDGFERRLCGARSARAAHRLVVREGRDLWKLATARAQGRTRVAGSLPGGDDRPLYWARVSMTASLAEWQPRFRLTAGQRDRLDEALETTTRGQDTIALKAGRRGTRVLVTGFDPFTLDRDDRIGNPSGANALALDGTTVRTPHGRVQIETAMFPVRWDDFADGEVERTLQPYLEPGPRRVDVLTTVSQGSPGRFDLEVWNGANRGGFADNENLERTGIVPIPDGVATVDPQPQWTRTSLPAEQMAADVPTPFRVDVHHEIVERDPVTGVERTTSDGPTPGSLAVEGGGGDYLSNEIAYRATLLRDATRSPNAGGHIHTPVLEGLPADGSITGAAFEDNRAAIVRQARGLVLSAAAHH